jgi:Tol biopolymer transport system component
MMLTFIACEDAGIVDNNSGPLYQLVFGSGPSPDDRGLYVANQDGSGYKRLTTGVIPQTSSIAPDGGSIVFHGFRPHESNLDIWRIDKGDTAAVLIIPNPASDICPCWSRDGTTVFFGSNRSGHWSIWAATPDGQNVRQLISDTLETNGVPIHSPVASVIAFVTYTFQGTVASGRLSLYDYSRSQLSLITDDSLDIKTSTLSWSPAGDRLAFVAVRRPNPDGLDLYTVDTSGSSVNKWTVGLTVNNPAWSPGSELIVYSTQAEIRILDCRTGQSRTLTSSLFLGQPAVFAWSPDGKTIAIEASDPSNVFVRQIFLMPVSGGQPRRATSSTFTEYGPQWNVNRW